MRCLPKTLLLVSCRERVAKSCTCSGSPSHRQCKSFYTCLLSQTYAIGSRPLAGGGVQVCASPPTRRRHENQHASRSAALPHPRPSPYGTRPFCTLHARHPSICGPYRTPTPACFPHSGTGVLPSVQWNLSGGWHYTFADGGQRVRFCHANSARPGTFSSAPGTAPVFTLLHTTNRPV